MALVANRKTQERPPRAIDAGHSLVQLTHETDHIGFPVRVIGKCECGKTFSNRGGDEARANIFRRHHNHQTLEAVRA